MVSKAANARGFAADDADVGKGTAGDGLVSCAADGSVAAETALRVFGGAKLQEIPNVKNNNV